jgi:hypothetical protein
MPVLRVIGEGAGPVIAGGLATVSVQVDIPTTSSLLDKPSGTSSSWLR